MGGGGVSEEEEAGRRLEVRRASRRGGGAGRGRSVGLHVAAAALLARVHAHIHCTHHLASFGSYSRVQGEGLVLTVMVVVTGCELLQGESNVRLNCTVVRSALAHSATMAAAAGGGGEGVCGWQGDEASGEAGRGAEPGRRWHRRRAPTATPPKVIPMAFNSQVWK